MSCPCAANHDGSPCLHSCHLAYEGRDGAPAMLSDKEVAGLGIIAHHRLESERLLTRGMRGGRYADDLAPMVYRTEDANGRLATQTATWRIALEVD